MASTTLSAQITYIARNPLYETEKPYALAFPVPDSITGVKSTNHTFDKQQMLIRDARSFPPHRLDISGFTFAHWPTSLQPEDFESSRMVQYQYFPEIEKLLLENFPEYTEIVYMDHNLRKRSPAFPEEANRVTKYAQPLTLPHLDFTRDSAKQRLEQVIEADGLEHLRGRSFDQINIWRVIRGPNNDWPLAVCDFSTIDLESDALASDLIFLDAPSEDYILCHNPKHKWYYMKDQAVEDVLILRNANSEEQRRPCAWHASFDPFLSHTEGARPTQYRESVDVRVFAFR